MVVRCSSSMCQNKKNKTRDIVYHRFPKNIDLCNKWAKLCHRFDLVDNAYGKCNNSQRLCSIHFEPHCYSSTGKLCDRAIPSIFSWTVKCAGTDHQKHTSSTNICEMSASQNIVENDILDLPDEECSLVNTSEINREYTISSLPDCAEISNISGISRVACSSSITEDQLSQSIYSSGSTQTPQILSRHTPRKEKLKEQLITQKQKYENLQTEFNKLQKELSNASSLSNFKLMCDNFLSPEMSNFVKLNLNMENRYADEFKQFALTICFFGPIVYEYLKPTWGLPNIEMLQRVSERWEINAGFNQFVFEVLKLKSEHMSNESKQCVMCIDEMSLKSFVYYHTKKDVIHGFHDTGLIKTDELAKSVMVIMIRGLNDKWKQPLAFYFVSTSCVGDDLKNIIFNCINTLEKISFNVKVLISDLGSNFKRFATTLGISPSKPYFNVGTKEIIFMFDPPHLLKATRNNFFSYKFQSGNKVAEKVHLQTLFNFEKNSTTRLAPKLTEIHLNPNSFQKMRVKYASQVMSHTVAVSLETLLCLGVLPSTAQGTIDFIDSMNKLFDLFNSRSSTNEQSEVYHDVEPFNSPFKNLSFQADFLSKMSEYFSNLKILKLNTITNTWDNVINTYNIMFVHGWLVSIAGLLRLHSNLSKENNKVQTIYTSKLNQYCLENFFGIIRTQNGNCINPTPIQFKRTFKKLFSLNYFQHLENANCIDDVDSMLANLDDDSLSKVQLLITGNNPIINVQALPVENTIYQNLELPEQNAFKYICGFLLSKCLKYHNCEKCFEYAHSSTHLTDNKLFINFESLAVDSDSLFGSSVMQGSDFFQYIFQLDNVFNTFFKKIMLEEHVGQKLKDKMINYIFFAHPCDNFPNEFLVNLFIRFKIYGTLTHTNKFHHNTRSNKGCRKIKILSNL
ncbi:unnamed protein product [Macrosiphum euphorbiae]|uniref:THAP-type domain-containing protein n=1 Tax=Macrosiphum euphorbiae TaxID=13131 RepID=A0AAV0WCE7_9HEMI|nr:unnamed protein product [Macrosiphum euphorbiae]